MNLKQFSDAMGAVDDKYVSETLNYKKKIKKPIWIKWCSLAACFCAVLALGMLNLNNSIDKKPNPEMVQVANPIIEVNSAEEMKDYLDFSVPVLEKNVETYSVIVADDYPTTGQIDYTDGSEYRIQYGSGDISGIRGGVLTDTKKVGEVEVSYYTFDGVDSKVTYAIWEEDNYTFSYIYTGDGGSEIQTLIDKFNEIR